MQRRKNMSDMLCNSRCSYRTADGYCGRTAPCSDRDCVIVSDLVIPKQVIEDMQALVIKALAPEPKFVHEKYEYSIDACVEGLNDFLTRSLLPDELVDEGRQFVADLLEYRDAIGGGCCIPVSERREDG